VKGRSQQKYTDESADLKNLHKEEGETRLLKKCRRNNTSCTAAWGSNSVTGTETPDYKHKTTKQYSSVNENQMCSKLQSLQINASEVQINVTNCCVPANKFQTISAFGMK
jgi:hypothetical protein